MEELLTFLGRYFDTELVNKSTDLFSTGLVNSLFSMQLLMFLEKTYGITVENEDINIENFHTIEAILKYIERKKDNNSI